MPTISITATFISRQEQVLTISDQEWADLQSGKKKYYNFLDSSEFDSGEWTEGFVVNEDTMDTI